MQLQRVKLYNSTRIGRDEYVSLTSPEFKLELQGHIIKVEDKTGNVVYVPLTNVPYFTPLKSEDAPVKKASGSKRTPAKKAAKAKLA